MESVATGLFSEQRKGVVWRYQLFVLYVTFKNIINKEVC
jgi:hypothetical protein